MAAAISAAWQQKIISNKWRNEIFIIGIIIIIMAASQ